jgi:hypothetical protein
LVGPSFGDLVDRSKGGVDPSWQGAQGHNGIAGHEGRVVSHD